MSNSNNYYEISFKVKDVYQEDEVSPSNISAALLNSFVEQVAKFVRGSERIDLNSIKTSIKEGSLCISASGDKGQTEQLAKDYEHIAIQEDLQEVEDSLRRSIIEAWQKDVYNNPGRVYELVLADDEHESSINITQDTSYEVKNDIWVDVEEYVYGKVYDIGGKTNPNVHVGLEDGSTLKIASDSQFLAKDKKNRLYSMQLLRIAAKMNIHTKEMKDEKLLNFDDYNPSFDEERFEELVEKSTPFWKDVDSAQWVEHIRGNI